LPYVEYKIDRSPSNRTYLAALLRTEYKARKKTATAAIQKGKNL